MLRSYCSSGNPELRVGWEEKPQTWKGKKRHSLNQAKGAEK
jgi:hypothetical protein